MNVIIFAGGAGTRLWPLSRRNSPKQFETLKDGKSTLQMCMDRIKSFGSEHTFISTNARYHELVRNQVHELADDHILLEPAKRDLTAAVGLTLLRLKHHGVRGTVALLWADHFMDYPDRFVNALNRADTYIQTHPKQLVFFGETPRFPNQNLGWIHVGKTDEYDMREFLGWKYHPELTDCEEMFGSGDWLWNPGYFIFDIDFMLELYQQHVPDMYHALVEMTDDESKIEMNYLKLKAVHFDCAIIEKIDQSQAVVFPVELGWSDPGTLYALKEALVHNEDSNYTKGNTVLEKTRDSFVYNEEDKKILAAVGLDGIVVVNTKDALLICHKNNVPDIKELLKKIEEKGEGEYL